MGKFLVEDSAKVTKDKVGDRFRTNDDLHLDLLQAGDIPPHVLFPDQLNRYLREQVQNLTLENGSLRRSLEEMQSELTAVKVKSSKAAPPTVSGRASEIAANKIAELSKKLREQNAELESWKYRARESESKLRSVEESSSSQVIEPPTPSQSELTEKDKQIKTLTEKLQATNIKMCDFRNQCQALKQEVKLAQKVIENEVGERVVLQDISKDSSSWRGRAQQIIALQNKVQHLQEQLSSSSIADTPAVNVIRQIEKDRRASYEETSKQLNQKTIQMEDLRKKLDASKARNKVLESDVVQMKTKLASVFEKGARDEQLISALTAQINMFEERGKSQIHVVNKMQDNISKHQREIELERCKNEQLQKALADRESRIQRMQEQLEDLRKQRRNMTENSEESKTVELGEEKSAIPLATDRRISATAETERMRLLELLTVLNRRLEEARREQLDAESQLRKEKCKNAKMETKIARLELERVGAIKSGRGSYSQSSSKQSDLSLDDVNTMTRHQIEYLEEECLALRTRIQTLQMEKEEDMKAFAAVTEIREPKISDRSKKSNKKTCGKLLNRKPNLKSRKSHSPSPVRQGSFTSDDSRSYDEY